MKKLLSILCSLLLAAGILAGCSGGDSSISSSDGGNEQLQEVYLTLDAYSMVGMLSCYEDDGTGTMAENLTGAYSFIAHPGQSVSQVLEQAGVANISVVSEEDTFEGWMVYKETITLDADGFETHTFELISGDSLFTMDELLEQEMSDFSVYYVAKWAGISPEEYYEMYEQTYNSFDEDYIEYYLSLYSNDGVIYMGEEEPYYEIDLGGYALVTGSTLGDAIDTPIQRVEKEGAAFTGWSVYTAPVYDVLAEAPDALNENELGIDMGDYGYLLLQDYCFYSENATTDELCSIICEEIHYFAVPNWE